MRVLYALVLIFVISFLVATSSAEISPRFKRQYGSMGGMGGSQQSYGQSSQMGSSMGGSQMGGGSPMGGMGGWGR
ncbi:hypothetical protein TELCIR_03795 [Teladorsagia circumcincta]|uniref:Uncharacterized protein n=1 Tax=Teladorsagia circumcincta TaxID=45464 RepID=A0A2G9UVF2_TELCI|nr:hypothetical protein TELCIR_03795 [Teladorsagia circumcincta]